MRGALSGITVLDLTRLLPGPFCTQVLADLGARVLKVEEPGLGDYARWIPPDVDGAGFTFSALNRGKASVAIDLKSPGGAAVLRRLARRADVLAESFRPGVLERLGLGPEVLLSENPRLIVLRLSGYGQSGPLRDAVGHDLNYEALAGIVAISGPAERPMIPVVPVADLAGGLYGAVAVLAALRERDRTGRGRVLDVALSDAALGVNAWYVARATSADPPRRGALELTGATPSYNVYRAGDGGWVALGALEPKFWERYCGAVGRADWAERHLDRDLVPDVQALFETRPRDEWVTALAKAGVPATPVLDPTEVLDDAHVRARLGGGNTRPLPSPGSPLTHAPISGRLPGLGEDTDAVLREHGLDDAEIAALRASGAIA